jgi:hypothetical protein
MNSSTGRRNDPGNRRPEKTIAYVISPHHPSCQPLYDPTETVYLPWPLFPSLYSLIHGFALNTQRSALLSLQICIIVLNVLFEILAIAIACTMLLRISVKFSPDLSCF